MNAASLVLLALVAQATHPTANTETKARAQALLKEGTTLYQAGDLAGALEKFNQAYTEYPSPKLLFNIGQTERDLGRLAEAMVALERFLAEAIDAPPDMSADAKKSVVELQPKLGRLLIECPTPGAEISVDGRVVGLAPVEGLIWVAPGRHQVVARHPTTTPAIEDVDVVAGRVHTAVMRLQSLATPAIVAPVATPALAIEQRAAPSATPSPARADAGWWLGRKWTWVAAGSAVVFVATAAIFGTAMQSKFNSLNNSCGSASKSTVACGDNEIASVTTLKDTANAFWGLAGAAVLTAGVLFFVEGRPVTVAPMAGETTGLLASVRY